MLQVSWVRYRDTSLLAVGKFVYVGDDRFRVIHEPHAAEWYLAIKVGSINGRLPDLLRI